MNATEWYEQGKVAAINGLEVFFNRSGEGETLLCIHGLPTSSWDFERIWPALTSRFDTIALDLIGLGKSAKPNQPLPISLQADVIETLLIKLEIKKAHILAHDLGDTVAQELLARKMEKSSPITWLSCIFLNGGIFPETHRPLLIQKLIISPIGGFIVKLMSSKSFEKNMKRVFSDKHPPSDEFLKESWNLLNDNNGLRMLNRLIHYMPERVKFRERWVSPLIANVVPLRLINGVDDPISGKHAADRYVEVVPNSDIVLLEQCGHYPHVETPDEVVKALIEFHNNLRN